MPAIRSPEASLWCDHSDNRVKKTPGLVDEIRKPFVVSIGEISLKRGGLDGIDRQNREQDRVSAERFLVRSNNAGRRLSRSPPPPPQQHRRLIQPAFGRAQTLRSGFRFARTPPDWCYV